MDEEPIEVTPLALVQEPESEEAAPEPPSAAPPLFTAAPPLFSAAPPLPTAAPAPTQHPANVPHLATATAPPHATPAAAVAHVELAADVTAQVAALEAQITARPEAKGVYIKLADLYQHAGQKDAAAAVLERLLGVDPGNALAKHRIDVLRGTVHHAPPAVIGLRPVARPARPVARPPGRGSSRRRLWIGLAALAVVVIAAGVWLLSGPSRLVAGRGPVFSLQGDRIAFFTDAAGGASLGVYDLKSGRSRTIGPASGAALGGDAVAWSPDGRQIAFAAPREGEMGEEAVFVADVESGARRELATGSSPTWSPDGLSIGMFCHERPRVMATISTEEGAIPSEFGEGWYGVCLVSIADGSIRRLHQGTGSRLAFSPQTQTLVLERFPEELPEAAAAGAPAGGDDELQALADEAVAGGATNFYEGSRDLGRAIEARGLDKRGAGAVGSVVGDLFALDAVSGALTALTSDGRSSNPRWTADGRIVYVHQPAEAPRAELWVMSVDGSGKEQFVQAPIELFDPAAVAVGGDRVVYAAPLKDVNTGLAKIMTGEEAADLYLVRHGDKAPRRLKNRHAFKQRFALSADGRRLVYEANDRKTGQSELWLTKP
jgi:Tol biopolymer transport system component